MADLEQEFRSKLREGLQPLTALLVKALRQLILHEYPSEVFAVCFEVFPDRWSDGFPVRAFFLDATNTEHFVHVDGKVHYPSPIDPGLIQASQILTPEYEDGVHKRAAELDYFTVGANEFIDWFFSCWKAAGGLNFRLRASVADHGSDRELNLITGAWQSRYADFSPEDDGDTST